jgi:archaellin
MRKTLRLFSFACLIVCLSAAYAQETAETIAPSSGPIIGHRHLVLNGEAIRSVWGFDVYKVRLYVHEIMRDAGQILGSKKEPKRIEIVLQREVSEEQFSSTVQQNIDNNFSDEEKAHYAGELKSFLGCFDNGNGLHEGSVITIDHVPSEGMVVKLDAKTLDTIPGADFYHAILRLWIGKPLQKSIKEGLVGTED